VVLSLVVAGLAGCQAPDRTAGFDPSATDAPSSLASTPVATESPTPSASSSPDATPAPPAASATSAAPRPRPRPSATSAPPNLASRLRTLPASTTQVVIVHSSGYATTYATLETFQKSGGGWRRAFSPMSARIGKNGFTDRPSEGLSATPTGVYGFGSTMYGNSADPGVRYAYHHLVNGDYWDENPDSPTYNTFVHGADPGGASEALWQSPTAYSAFAFITYNVPVVPGKGSAIFLHQSNGNPTAGCVSLARADLVRVLTWLNPSAHPRIVMGPDSVLGRY
jgi:L,D-peptidoglycan transpeptidase YkuD (ErfK/YbiS/YcfS/YnhG family)